MPAERPFEYVRQGFDTLYGLEVTDISDQVANGRVEVRDELKQPGGLVHGGVYAAIAESLASWGTMLGVAPEGKVALGLSNQTNFLRPISGGAIHATATRRHRGRTTWVWEVEISDDGGRLCVLTRVTIAVRDASSLQPGADGDRR
jgi:1,4-dihydroxy-2-naphthoyl-CoA hydrolase